MVRYPCDNPVVYAIHVAGRVDKSWTDRLGGMSISCTEEEDNWGKPVTVLLGTLPDQEALHGVIIARYNACYPILLIQVSPGR